MALSSLPAVGLFLFHNRQLSDMRKRYYLVSVFVAGKCVHSHFSEELDDLVTIVALYPRCELSIYDMNTLRALTRDEIYAEVVKARERCKDAMEKREAIPSPLPEPEDKTQPVKRVKNWKRTVLCVETKQVFNSVRDCSDHIGLPYTTIVNCIKNKNATRGLHFITIDEDEN